MRVTVHKSTAESLRAYTARRSAANLSGEDPTWREDMACPGYGSFYLAEDVFSVIDRLACERGCDHDSVIRSLLRLAPLGA